MPFDQVKWGIAGCGAISHDFACALSHKKE